LDLIQTLDKRYTQSEVWTKSGRKNRLHFLGSLWTWSEFWTEQNSHPKSEVAQCLFVVDSILRPVLLIAPFASTLIAKLTSESPDKFCCLDFGMIFYFTYFTFPSVTEIVTALPREFCRHIHICWQNDG